MICTARAAAAAILIWGIVTTVARMAMAVVVRGRTSRVATSGTTEVASMKFTSLVNHDRHTCLPQGKDKLLH